MRRGGFLTRPCCCLASVRKKHRQEVKSMFVIITAELLGFGEKESLSLYEPDCG